MIIERYNELEHNYDSSAFSNNPLVKASSPYRRFYAVQNLTVTIRVYTLQPYTYGTKYAYIVVSNPTLTLINPNLWFQCNLLQTPNRGFSVQFTYC